MPEFRSRKNTRRIAQNTEAGKRMLDSFLRSNQAELGSEDTEREYAADLMTGGMEDLAYSGSGLMHPGTAKAERPHQRKGIMPTNSREDDP